MAGRQYSVEDVLAYMEIPLPEDDDDDFSGDEFDGYISEDDDRVQGGDGYESGGEDGSGDVVGAVGGGGAAGEEDDVQIPAYEQFGCTQDMSDKPPLEFFKLMVTDDMLQTIVEQTNLYADQFTASHNLAPRSRVHGWKKVTHDLNELKKLLALIVVMSLVNYPTLEDYWATYWPYATPTFSKVSQCGVDVWPHLLTRAREHKLEFFFAIPKLRGGSNFMRQQSNCNQTFHAKFLCCHI